MVRRLNLVKEDGELDSAAPLRLFARMLWPSDRVKRHAYIRSHLASPLLIDGKMKDKGLAPAKLGSRMRRGGNAGDLLLYDLQMDKHRTAGSPPASLRQAVPYTRGAHLHDVGLNPAGLPPAHELTTVEWHDTRTRLADRKVGRTALLKDFEECRGVAHYWAAAIVAQLQSTPRLDFLERPDQLLPFIAVST